MEKRLSVHRLGSVRKSGNDLWKIRMGCPWFAGTWRREWRVCRKLVTLAGVTKLLRRVDKVLIESGWKDKHHCPQHRLELGVEPEITWIFLAKSLLQDLCIQEINS
jgi:hypothetical protein